jgi:hypothetical protein
MKKFFVVIFVLFIGTIVIKNILHSDIRILKKMKTAQDIYHIQNNKYAVTVEELGFSSPQKSGTSDLLYGVTQGGTHFTIVPLSFKNINIPFPKTVAMPLNDAICKGYEICGYEDLMFSSLIKTFYYFKSIPNGYEFKIDHSCDRYSYIIRQDESGFSAECVSLDGECPYERQLLLSIAPF